MPVLDLIHEKKVSILDYLITVSGLVDREVPFFLTATNWGRLADEIVEKDMPREAVSPDPAKFIGFSQAEFEASRGNLLFKPTAVKPNPRNFRQLRIGKLTVINSHSEDQGAVNEANTQAAAEAGVMEQFRWKRDNLRIK